MGNQRRKLWVGVGAFVLLGGQGADAIQAATPGQPETAASPSVLLASAAAGGESSHGGEGGEGGEAGEAGEAGHGGEGGEGGEAGHGGEGGEGGEAGHGGEGGAASPGGEGGEGGEASHGGEAGHGGEGGEGGEAVGAAAGVFGGGEGGEGGEGGGGHVAATDSAGVYYSQLGYMLGHLRTARALYEAGEPQEASGHLAHPAAEHLPVVRAALQERGLGDVAAQVERLAEAAGNEPAWSDVAEAHAATEQAVVRAMNDVSEARRQSAEFQVKVLTAILRQARHEYEEAVEGERIAHPHEYRDSWGFVQVGRQLLEDNADVFRAGGGDYDELVARYEAAMAAWPSIAVPAEPPVSVSQLYGRVAAFELVASQY